MNLIITLIVGGLIGWIAGLILHKDIPGGKIGNIIAGLLGAWVGGMLLPKFGPVWGDVAIFPALIGTIVLILVVSFILRLLNKSS